jgi:hypothetical protein
MGVGELKKAPHIPCQHICESGCGIYDTRPTSCREFRCLWLDGNVVDDHLRPDLSKVVWALMPNAITRKPCWTAYEAEKGALDRPEMQTFIQLISQREFVLLLPVTGQRRFLGPDYKMGKMIARVKALAGRQGKDVQVL